MSFWHGLTHTAAVMLNLIPGLPMELTERRWLRPGGAFVENWHPFLCRRVDQEFGQLGFTPLGHLLCAELPGWVLRGFAHQNGGAWAVHYVGILAGSGMDLVTEFSNHHWVTTTTLPMAIARQGQTIQSFPSAGLYELCQAHRQLSDEIDAEPVFCEPDLEELRCSIERFFKETGFPNPPL